MFHAEYSSGQPLKMLADLRTVIEEALTRSESGKAAAAGVSAPTSSSSERLSPAAAAAQPPAPEFSILAGQHEDGEL